MNKTAGYKLTIAIPVYNEEGNLKALESALADYLPKCLMKACVLLIDDCSSDNSLDMIRDICGRHSDFFYVCHTRRLGCSGAMKTAIDSIESEYMAYTDADLQTVPEEFNLMLPYAAEYPLVAGVRSTREDGWRKKLQSRIGNGFRRMMTGDGARDSVCPMKVIKMEYARRLPMLGGMHRFLPALILLQEGGRYKEVMVTHRSRTAGRSKFNMFNRLRGFTDCFIYRWMRRNWVTYNHGENNL
ncbi:MAG: glycosyltransferase family 2 protein [Bacteroidales bacterium]|nr:glycosyltransferase family 2 protein [Bacteroidales bacterium]